MREQRYGQCYVSHTARNRLTADSISELSGEHCAHWIDVSVRAHVAERYTTSGTQGQGACSETLRRALVCDGGRAGVPG